MNEIKEYNQSIFESIKHIDENGNEYWYARELQNILKYSQWRRFKELIDRAKIACELSKNDVFYHFAVYGKTIKMPKNAIKTVEDYKLSRYACYLIVQNGNPNKEVIALGQTYFAIQTRKQEMTEEYFKSLNEDERRLVVRGQTIDKNKLLYKAAKDSGVENYGKFTNCGYKGLYGGETAKDIAKRKGISDKEEILDYMGSEELADNLFRIVQTESKLKKDKIDNEYDANNTHYEVGSAVRETIKKLGGTMPEDLPTPEKSIPELETEKLTKIEN
ncbi:MAG: DNA damage-inducible protein D [Bacilli bacterium]|nr:DNA damage-inducible protein D [Bacilli bacterium]